MTRAPTIKSAMTPFPYSVDIKTPIPAAQAEMKEHAIRHLPVTDEGTLIGIVSDRDIRRVLGPDFDYPNPATLVVGDAMVDEAYVVDLNTPLAIVLHHMAEHHYGSALVTRKGKLAGVFTSTDACKAFAEHLDAHFPPPGGNAAA